MLAGMCVAFSCSDWFPGALLGLFKKASRIQFGSAPFFLSAHAVGTNFVVAVSGGDSDPTCGQKRIP